MFHRRLVLFNTPLVFTGGFYKTLKPFKMKKNIFVLIVLVTVASCSKEYKHSTDYDRMCWTIIYKDSIGYTCPPYTDTLKFPNH
jgi:hypothetical protein